MTGHGAVAVMGERSREDRDTALRAAAVDVDDDEAPRKRVKRESWEELVH